MKFVESETDNNNMVRIHKKMGSKTNPNAIENESKKPRGETEVLVYLANFNRLLSELFFAEIYVSNYTFSM